MMDVLSVELWVVWMVELKVSQMELLWAFQLVGLSAELRAVRKDLRLVLLMVDLLVAKMVV